MYVLPLSSIYTPGISYMLLLDLWLLDLVLVLQCCQLDHIYPWHGLSDYHQTTAQIIMAIVDQKSLIIDFKILGHFPSLTSMKGLDNSGSNKVMGEWFSGRAPAFHSEGPGFNLCLGQQKKKSSFTHHNAPPQVLCPEWDATKLGVDTTCYL